MIKQLEEYRERSFNLLSGFERTWANDDVLNEAIAFDFSLLPELEKKKILDYFQKYNQLQDRVKSILPGLSDPFKCRELTLSAPGEVLSVVLTSGRFGDYGSDGDSVGYALDGARGALYQKPRPDQEVFILNIEEINEEVERRIVEGLDLIAYLADGQSSFAGVLEQLPALVARAWSQKIFNFDKPPERKPNVYYDVFYTVCEDVRRRRDKVKELREELAVGRDPEEVIEVRALYLESLSRFWRRRFVKIKKYMDLELNRPAFSPYMERGSVDQGSGST